MKILFDIISTQSSINGGAEYTRRILSELIKRCFHNKSNEIIGLYDSSIPFVKIYDTVHYSAENNIKLVDINNYKSLSEIIQNENIDCFFIGIGQRFIQYNIANIHCNTVMVIHDVFDYEIRDNRLNYYLLYRYGTNWDKLKTFIKTVLYKKKDYSNVISLFNQQNVFAVTVSEYSKGSLEYYFPQLLGKDMKVLYSPQKIAAREMSITNNELSNLIDLKKKYYLIVSADRFLKNAKFVIDTFNRVCEYKNDIYLLTIGNNKSCFENHIVLPHLNSSDLEHAYENAYSLIFASIEEGFGYPPLEAMKYGVPVICSNVCSMLEILEDSCLYFSPFYKNDLFNKVLKLEGNRELYRQKSILHSKRIQERQEKDLATLLNMILPV